MAFKGGEVNRGHGQLDVGNFVLDALGVRWAEQTGADNYNLPGYSNRGSGQRWTYYRIRAEGQNTLVINPGAGPDQNLAAKAPIIHLASRPNEAVGIVDMDSAYAPHARVRRGIALFDHRRQVMIQDEIQADDPAEVWWFMHTKASVHIDADGRTATLQRGGKQLMARILSPSDAVFEVMPARPLPTSPDPPGQNPNTEFRKLAIHLQDVTETTLAVQFLPVKDSELAPIQPVVVPLSEWMEAETHIWPVFPRVILSMDSPRASERVAGTVPVELRLETPAEIEVSDVTVTFANQLIFEGTHMPDQLHVDTRPLSDGSHGLGVRITLKDGGEVFQEFPIRVNNHWHMTDAFQPPITGWLGTFDFSQTFAASDGWGYATEQRDGFFDDNDRRVRTGPGTEYLIWESHNLERYQLSVYAPTVDIEKTLRIDISPDADSWHEHPYEISVKDRNSEGRFHLVVTGQLPENTANWFRVTLRQSDLPYEEIQLGELQLWGRNW